MAGLKIKNETVFVIYRNGQPYEAKGRKIVYTSKGAANGVITSDADDIARDNYDKEVGHTGAWHDGGWWDLSRDDRDIRIAAVKNEFEVVEYGPKREGKK